MPVDVGPCAWDLPDPREAPGAEELICVGADLEPSTLIAAYRSGLFPMPLDDEAIGWWSPDPRGVLPIEAMVVHRSLQKAARRFTITVDTDFTGVLRGCADRPGLDDRERWLTEPMRAAYARLHDLGWAHSIEVWSGDVLVGGLYGVEIGGLFAGESMFHRERDASKVALLALAERLRACGGSRLIDVQWSTDHLRSLGVIEMSRDDYLDALSRVTRTPACLGA